MNRVNVKHVIGPCEEIAIGKEVTVKLNARLYRSTVVDLLDWIPPKKKETSRKQQKKGKDLERKKAEQVYFIYEYYVRLYNLAARKQV